MNGTSARPLGSTRPRASCWAMSRPGSSASGRTRNRTQDGRADVEVRQRRPGRGRLPHASALDDAVGDPWKDRTQVLSLTFSAPPEIKARS